MQYLSVSVLPRDAMRKRGLCCRPVSVPSFCPSRWCIVSRIHTTWDQRWIGRMTLHRGLDCRRLSRTGQREKERNDFCVICSMTTDYNCGCQGHLRELDGKLRKTLVITAAVGTFCFVFRLCRKKRSGQQSFTLSRLELHNNNFDPYYSGANSLWNSLPTHVTVITMSSVCCNHSSFSR